ncbi:hypothetical protein RRG08_055506 [Elysia crispata]|uniref:Uncharacterized protein n=1 Tax=Elysia crispata TaxID=231223 RepID=A0AAE1AHA4_9GAST|nr:hypothetical protein RRG08_055506 [Elysia crispata]
MHYLASVHCNMCMINIDATLKRSTYQLEVGVICIVQFAVTDPKFGSGGAGRGGRVNPLAKSHGIDRGKASPSFVSQARLHTSKSHCSRNYCPQQKKKKKISSHSSNPDQSSSSCRRTPLEQPMSDWENVGRPWSACRGK